MIRSPPRSPEAALPSLGLPRRRAWRRSVQGAQERADAAVDLGLSPEFWPGDASGLEGSEEVGRASGVFVGLGVKDLYARVGTVPGILVLSTYRDAGVPAQGCAHKRRILDFRLRAHHFSLLPVGNGSSAATAPCKPPCGGRPMLSALLRYPLGCLDRGIVDRGHVSSTDPWADAFVGPRKEPWLVLSWSRVDGRWYDILK